MRACVVVAVFSAVVALVASQAAEYEPVCWKGTQPRGAGTIPDSCDASQVCVAGTIAFPVLISVCCVQGLEKDGLLCYPVCQSGYTVRILWSCKLAGPHRLG
jgi:hypothetical protein